MRLLEEKRPSGDLAGPDGLTDVVPTDQGSVPSLRWPAVYERSAWPTTGRVRRIFLSTIQFMLHCEAGARYFRARTTGPATGSVTPRAPPSSSRVSRNESSVAI